MDDSALIKKYQLKSCYVDLVSKVSGKKALVGRRHRSQITSGVRSSTESCSESSSSDSDSSESDSDWSETNRTHRTQKVLPKKGNLKKNLKSAETTKRVKCQMCCEKFNSRGAFAYHMKFNHPEVKLYVCTYSDCEKSFSLKKKLKDHLKSHYRYVCKFCKMGFIRKYRMQQHVLHTHQNQDQSNN